MPILDEIFARPAEILPSHPLIRNWSERIRQTGEKPTIEVFRPTLAIGLAQSEMTLHFKENGQALSSEEFIWDDELNNGLLNLGVQAINSENEVERFVLGLRAAVRKATREFGDGFFNSVLLDFFAASELKNDPEVSDILLHAHAIKPKAGKQYDDCCELIADAIVGRKFELEKMLGYEPEVARTILKKVLIKYLDQRFSISNRRRLGLL